MIYTIENQEMMVQIKDMGAELTSILDKKTGRELLWQGDPAFWASQAPVLFPIVGRLKDNRYRYRQKTYELNLHGFARKSLFELESEGDEAITFSLRASEETKQSYPFEFSLLISYILKGRCLEVHYLVSNPSESEPLYFSLGAHPGFAFRGPIEKQQICFSEKENLDRLLLNENVRFIREVEKDFVKEGGPIDLTPHSFDQDALVFHGFTSGAVSLRSRESGEGVRLGMKNFTYIGFWSVPGAPYVCLEPWRGIGAYEDFDGELPEKDGIECLEPKGSFRASFSVEPLDGTAF